jgi:hypothetical protein
MDPERYFHVIDILILVSEYFFSKAKGRDGQAHIFKVRT